ncbi:hypothetical protein, partial [Leptothrix ochracea]|uniref:hypothetical protein n=1 Tax=Leptothrix ochracea TaxID=735331 RepID=UPI0034E19CE8
MQSPLTQMMLGEHNLPTIGMRWLSIPNAETSFEKPMKKPCRKRQGFDQTEKPSRQDLERVCHAKADIG